jgi:hypothetical protein
VRGQAQSCVVGSRNVFSILDGAFFTNFHGCNPNFHKRSVPLKLLAALKLLASLYSIYIEGHYSSGLNQNFTDALYSFWPLPRLDQPEKTDAN